MLFNSALVFSSLFVSAVLADRRRERQSRFLDRIEQPPNTASDGVQYSNNWSGAVWQENGGTFTYVTGTFNVPAPSGQSGSAASAWVGIDGDTCANAILQAGVDFIVTDNGASYDAWYEWYPDNAYYFADFSMSVGDVIRVSVTATSTTSGNVQVENLSNGQSASQQLSSAYALCGQNAEWIVEDFNENGTPVPFANFGTVTFWDAAATGTGTYTPDGAVIMEIYQNNQVLTSASTGNSYLTVQYI
ncbi:peptidase G1 [Boletus edulis]|nr:peptidase G1 [Boletus edulis]